MAAEPPVDPEAEDDGLGVVLVATFAVVVMNLVVDILYSVLDPRIHLNASSDSVQASRKVVRQLRTQPQQAEPASPT